MIVASCWSSLVTFTLAVVFFMGRKPFGITLVRGLSRFLLLSTLASLSPTMTRTTLCHRLEKGRKWHAIHFVTRNLSISHSAYSTCRPVLSRRTIASWSRSIEAIQDYGELEKRLDKIPIYRLAGDEWIDWPRASRRNRYRNVPPVKESLSKRWSQRDGLILVRSSIRYPISSLYISR